MQRSGGDEDDDTLLYVLPPMLMLIVVGTVGVAVWFGLVRKKQKKRLGMAMTSGKPTQEMSDSF